ncbi:MAG: hypothetical protein H0U78_01365 [Rickettsiaceae bacterium]|nr:hypothetical protein [Rickettsiaceae bacterium]
MKSHHFTDKVVIFDVIRRLDYVALNRLINKDATLINQPREADGFTPLHSAVAANRLEGVELLLAVGACPNQPCNTGVTPLGLALKTADTNPVIIKKLIIQGGTFLDKNVELYHQQRVKKYGEEMVIEDLTDGRITTKSQLQQEVRVIFTINLADRDNSQIIDDLRKLLLSDDFDEDVFSKEVGIERCCSPMVKNLSGDYNAHDEIG